MAVNLCNFICERAALRFNLGDSCTNYLESGSLTDLGEETSIRDAHCL